MATHTHRRFIDSPPSATRRTVMDKFDVSSRRTVLGSGESYSVGLLPDKKSNSRLSDLRIQMLAQARRARSTISSLNMDPKLKKAQTEKRVLNSFTQLVESKDEKALKQSLIVKVVEKKLRDRILKSGNCKDIKKVDETAKKMAAFIGDVMNETCKNRQIKSRVNICNRETSRNDKKVTSEHKKNTNDNSFSKSNSRFSTKSALESIPEEAMIRNRFKPGSSVSSHTQKTTIDKVDKLKESKKSPVSNKAVPMTRSKSACSKESISIKNEKAKINSWLTDVDKRTKKWTEWIGETIAKAEQSKNRLSSGENVREVSGDWKKFMQVKKQESENFGETPSIDWSGKREDNEALRKRGQESIQQWLLKNKLNRSTSQRSQRSNISVSSISSDTLSFWNSTEPSSIYAGESELSKLKQLGLIRPSSKM